MRPEVILQSSMLDILFENKNKEYGAYALRKNYNKRLIQALGGTCLVVGLFVALQSMKPANDSNEGSILAPDTHLTDVIIPKEDRPKETRQKEVIHQQEKVKTLTDFAPVIKPE